MKTVLLPVDFSKNSWNAVFTALKLYDRISCHFILLHAYQAQLGDLKAETLEQKMWSVFEELKREAEEKVSKMIDYLEREHENRKHSFSGSCIQGELLTAVRTVLEKEPIDLIVMGTQGASGAARIFMGSNTVRVLRKVRNRPILVVPGTFDFQRLNSVVFPTDFMRAYEPAELQPLTELLQQWEATLHVVYATSETGIKPEQESLKEILESRLKGIKYRMESVPFEKSLKDTLMKQSRKDDAQLIALVQYRHDFFESLLKEPVVKRMAFESKLPLLVLPQLL